MKLIDKYLILLLFKNIFIVTLILLILFSLFNLSAELNDIDQRGYSFISALNYVALMIPKVLSEINSITILIGSVLTLDRLVSFNEAVILYTGSVSPKKIITRILQFTFLFSLIFFIFNEITAKTFLTKAEIFKAQKKGDDISLLGEKNIWLKKDNKIINIKNNIDGKNLEDVTTFEFYKNKLREVRFSKEAFIESNVIQLSNPRGYDLVKEKKLFRLKNNNSSVIKNADFLMDQSGYFAQEPSRLNFSQLLKYSLYFYESDMDNTIYINEVISRINKPIITALMIFIALPICFNKSRRRNSSKIIVIAVIIGLMTHLLVKLFSIISFKFSYSVILPFFPLIILYILGKYLSVKRIENHERN